MRLDGRVDVSIYWLLHRRSIGTTIEKRTPSAYRMASSSYLICKLMHKQHTNGSTREIQPNDERTKSLIFSNKNPTVAIPLCDRFWCAVRTHFIYNFVSAVKEMLFRNVSVFIDRRCRLFNKIRRIRKSMVFRAISTVKQSAFGFRATYTTIELELNGTTEN